MDKEELRSVLYEHQLGRVADRLMELAAPTVRIYLQQQDDADLAVGSSKMGGVADLPEGVPWPSWHEPMAFIAQFNLADVAPYDPEGALPPQGLLSFFYETDGEPLYAARLELPEGAFNILDLDVSQSWRVLYHTGDPATFIRHQVPSEVAVAARYLPCVVRFALEYSLPYISGPEIGLNDAERNALIDIEHLINGGTWEDGGHHLLGFPYNLGGPALLGCAEESEHDSEWEHATLERRLELEREASERWRLLLQVSGSDLTYMEGVS